MYKRVLLPFKKDPDILLNISRNEMDVLKNIITLRSLGFLNIPEK